MLLERIFPEIGSRLVIGLIAAPFDYWYTGPILVLGLISYFILLRLKIRRPRRMAILLWGILMLFWWVIRFCLILYPGFHLA